MSYQHMVLEMRTRVTEAICMVVSSDEKKHARGIEILPGEIDRLNKAWDELTDCLVRQRDARDVEIQDLLNKLAEARKPR